VLPSIALRGAGARASCGRSARSAGPSRTSRRRERRERPSIRVRGLAFEASRSVHLSMFSLSVRGSGFETADGYLGVVSALSYAPSGRRDRPSALAVRPGGSGSLLRVPAHQVESVSLAEGRIVLRPSPRISATERVSAVELVIESLDRGEAKAPSVDEDGRAYWLSTCEGFRVDSKDGRVGVVEEVRFSSSKRPEALAVRTGLFRCGSGSLRSTRWTVSSLERSGFSSLRRRADQRSEFRSGRGYELAGLTIRF
jgi:hypothetical protein